MLRTLWPRRPRAADRATTAAFGSPPPCEQASAAAAASSLSEYLDSVYERSPPVFEWIRESSD